ncbi:hypothetical protein E2562_001838 [Oryza meyeriana var. granulata]|uniref:DUF7771 domain-containing protein n=1 Tax=Oryza meyeriana var. granulata TaxID=110450 RepID=A0A6G1CEK3_9ORYZ|nr:hypothetical protein E2562_001838 [Oryza meyeriana var. granulata]
MEEKKKDLLRRLTIISIPFVFVAIPSIVIIVGMLSPHAAEPRDAAALAPGQNHSVSMLSTMTGGQMILSCRAAFSGNWDSAAYATRCRVDEGGCRYLFQNGHMFLVTGRHATRAAPAQRREKALVGDVLLRECTHVLGVFPTMCRYKPHDHDYVGKIIGRWRCCIWQGRPI